MTPSDHDAVARAKADIAEFDRKINVIATEEARLEQQRLQMESERARIQAFVDMYERYTNRNELLKETNKAPKPAEVMMKKRLSKLKRARVRLELKPDNIPAMTEMITVALKVASEQGQKGLEPREMTDFIRQKWWPNVKGSSVSPIAWRMAEDGKLRKEGSVYRLPS